MKPRDSSRQEASTTPAGARHAWLSVALFVVLCLLVVVLGDALDRASVGSEPYHRSWLARAIDLSSHQLEKAGGWIALTGFVGWCLGLGMKASWPRLGATLLFGGVVVVVLGLVAFTDAACLGGYRASDGMCAWE